MTEFAHVPPHDAPHTSAHAYPHALGHAFGHGFGHAGAQAPRHARFPAIRLLSFADFQAWCGETQPVLDSRYLHELGLATTAETMTLPGTCAPCLRAARFTARTAGGSDAGGGRLVPNWREELLCDCTDRLGNRPRALLHFLQSTIGLHDWTRALVFGGAGTLAARLPEEIGALHNAARLQWHGNGPGLPEGDASFHLVVSSDYLHRVPPLDRALAELRRVLIPGGSLVFTVPFHHTRLETRADAAADGVETDAPAHEIGWDIIARLHAAGFRAAAAHVYWSEELGYLGPFNMIFAAEA